MYEITEPSAGVAFEFVDFGADLRDLRRALKVDEDALALRPTQDLERAVANERRSVHVAEQKFKLSLIDTDLTGLGSRAWVVHTLRGLHKVHRSTRSPVAYTVLLTDARGAKAVNDVYGHDLGDIYLALGGKAHEVAAKLLLPATYSAGASRYGGDEFMQIVVHHPDIAHQFRFATQNNFDPFRNAIELDSASLLARFHEEWIRRIINHPDRLQRAQMLSLVAILQRDDNWMARFGAATYPYDVRNPDDPFEVWTAAEGSMVATRNLEGRGGRQSARQASDLARIPLMTMGHDAHYSDLRRTVAGIVAGGRAEFGDRIAPDAKINAALLKRPDISTERNYDRVLDWLANSRMTIATTPVIRSVGL